MKAQRIVVLLMVAVLFSPALAGKGPGGGSTAPVLTQIEAQNLIFLREEEKLARDVYLAMLDRYHAQIFANISVSEQRHMDAVKSLIDKYRLQDPVVDDTPGAFTNPTLASLYQSLVEKGSMSFTDALGVGVIIEEMDIHDIEIEMLPFTTKTDIKQVLTNLLAGSYNHLDAFNTLLATQVTLE
jgi:hypothetical protein